MGNKSNKSNEKLWHKMVKLPSFSVKIFKWGTEGEEMMYISDPVRGYNPGKMW